MMYVVRTESWVNAGRAPAFIARVDALIGALKQHPGFLGVGIGNSNAYPTKYTGLFRFESHGSARDWMNSPALTAWADGAPSPPIATGTRPMEAYELIEDVPGTAEIRFAALVDWTLDNRPGNAEAFEESRSQLFALRRGTRTGLAGQRLHRFLGPGNRYLITIGSAEPFDVRSALSPEEKQFREAHPIDAYASTWPSLEVYEAVRVVTLAPA